jgi:hypothetical protein
MLASAPVFAASFLITKVPTRSESTGVIVFWQALTVTLFSLPLALLNWQWPTAWQWAGFLLCGALGSGGHYCLTRSFRGADISATQSLKFLELLWSALLGFALFADVPTATTLLGGAIITAATIWAARRGARLRRSAASCASTPEAPRRWAIRVANPIELDAQKDRELRVPSKRKRVEVRLQQRAHIALLAAKDMRYKEIVLEVGPDRCQMALWPTPVLEGGIDGLKSGCAAVWSACRRDVGDGVARRTGHATRPASQRRARVHAHAGPAPWDRCRHGAHGLPHLLS